MDDATRAQLEHIDTQDRALQNAAYTALMDATRQPVDWAYEAWDRLVALLRHPDNHQRAIAAQLLCSLAISDPDNRMSRDFDALLNVTRDERFVTARHALQSLWKIGTAGQAQHEQVVAGLSARFADCAAEKNCTLIRSDIMQGLRALYDASADESIKAAALALIDTEPDAKYRKKYASIWRTK